MRCYNCSEAEVRGGSSQASTLFCKVSGKFNHFNCKCEFSEAKQRELHIKPRGETWVATKLFWDVVSGRVK